MTELVANDTIRNGVDTAKLFATLDAVKAAPEVAQFQFRASNRWVTGTLSRTTISEFFGLGAEQTHDRMFVCDADHPGVLVGGDEAPTPVELLLHALVTCLTAGIANVAAARGVALTEVESAVEGDINLLGVLGLSDHVRNGFEHVRVSIRIKGDADDETLRGIVERSQRRSAVYDVITNGVPVSIEVATQHPTESLRR
jgi:uncharacterized OsmC-like protein